MFIQEYKQLHHAYFQISFIEFIGNIPPQRSEKFSFFNYRMEKAKRI